MNQLRPVEKALAEKVLAAVATSMGLDPTIVKVERKSDRDFDVRVECASFGLWLPLGAIRELTVWTSPAIADMTDYPEMVREGDWSGVRDSSADVIWEIFRQHVPKVVL